jgi:hypothetical protein
VLTGGERHEQIALEALLDQGAVRRPGRGRPRLRPRRVAGDKAYSSPTARRRLRRRGIVPVIPTKRDQRRQASFDREAYRARNRIERLINRLVWGSCGQEESDGYIGFFSGRDGACGQGRSREAGPKVPLTACPPLLTSWRRPMRQTWRIGHGCSSLAVAPSRRSIVSHHGDRW